MAGKSHCRNMVYLMFEPEILTIRSSYDSVAPSQSVDIHQLKNINHSLNINFFLKILTMHIVTACSLVSLIASLITCYISRVFKNIFKEKFFALRLFISIFIGQMILSFLWVEILLRYTDLLKFHEFFTSRNFVLAKVSAFKVPHILNSCM